MLNKKNWTIAAFAAASWVPMAASAGISQVDLYYVDAEVEATPVSYTHLTLPTIYSV